MTCTHATHDLMRASVYLFKACITNPQQWAGLLTGECNNCRSTIALTLCKLCTEPCATTDCLPWGEEGDGAHFGCVAQKVLATGKAKFVIVASGGKAREFCRGVAS